MIEIAIPTFFESLLGVYKSVFKRIVVKSEINTNNTNSYKKLIEKIYNYYS